MEQFMMFGKISLKQFPSGANMTLRHNYQLAKQQQYILNNLWIAKTSQEKLQAFHALVFYFNQLNRFIESKNFSFFLIIHDRQPSIYTY